MPTEAMGWQKEPYRQTKDLSSLINLGRATLHLARKVCYTSG